MINIEQAGVDQKIDVKIAPAADTLSELDIHQFPAFTTVLCSTDFFIENLLKSGEMGTYDFAFIDADKVGYDEYYELCLKLLRSGGIIAVDNVSYKTIHSLFRSSVIWRMMVSCQVLWSGSVADPSKNSPDTVALRELNKKLATDPRINVSLLNIGDGCTLAFKLWQE